MGGCTSTTSTDDIVSQSSHPRLNNMFIPITNNECIDDFSNVSIDKYHPDLIRVNDWNITHITECTCNICTRGIKLCNDIASIDALYICKISLSRLIHIVIDMNMNCTTDENKKEFNRIMSLYPLSANFIFDNFSNKRAIYHTQGGFLNKHRVPAYTYQNLTIGKYMELISPTNIDQIDILDIFNLKDRKWNIYDTEYLKISSKVLFSMAKLAYPNNISCLTLHNFLTQRSPCCKK